MFRPTNSAARQKRRGAVAALVAVSITLLLGIVAITLDGGLLQDNKRRVQNACDGAALAAATTLYKDFPTIQSSGIADPDGNAEAAALAYAAANGFPSTRADTKVVVHIPPTSGPFTDKLGYAEVIITFKQPRYFSTIWGSSAMPVVARAVAHGFWGGTGDGCIILDPTVKNALDSSGSGSTTITGGGRFVVNSNHSEAARVTGGGALKAAEFRITGKNPGYIGPLDGQTYTGVPPTPDPLAYLPVPTVPPNGTITTTNVSKYKSYYLTPGRFTNLPNFGNGDTVTLKQGGIYYIDGGGLNSTQGATILMDPPNVTTGVMIYNAPSGTQQNQGLNLSGGTVVLSPLQSGPYAGIIFWQDRTSPVTLSLQGQGGFNIDGTFYAANALMNVTGNGTNVIGSQYISRTLSLSGSGTTLINYTDKLTARKRVVRLVE
jgi:hypothetical protein